MMATLRGLARRHALVGFFILAYGLSWWPWLWYRLDPTIALGRILPFGPFLAALVMLVLAGGWPAVRGWLKNIVAWRVGLPWYVLALLLPAGITSVAVGVNLFLGAGLMPGAEPPGWVDLVVRFLVVFVLVGLGEEPAWRGYALPRLMQGRTPLAAALLLGLLHVLWHLPLFGVEYDFANLWPWLIAVLSVSVVITWMWLATGGNLLLPALLHATVNTVALPWQWFADGDLLRLWWIWAGLWLAVAAIVVIALGPALHQPKPRRMMG